MLDLADKSGSVVDASLKLFSWFCKRNTDYVKDYFRFKTIVNKF